MERLGDLVFIQSKSNIQAGEGKNIGKYKFFTSSNVQTKWIDEYQYNQPALIFGTGGMPSIHLCKTLFSTSTDCVVMYAKPNINLEYIYCYLATNMDILSKGFHGAGLQHISKKYLLDIMIPDLNKKIMDKITVSYFMIENLISKRHEQLEKLDLLIKAKFVEMFGIYPDNEKRWDIGTIRDVVNEVKYGSSRSAVENGKYPYLRMNNITYSGELDLTETKRIDVPENELPKCTVRRGDVLFNRTNSKELVGKTCVYNRDEMMVLAGFVIRVRVNTRVLPDFLSCYLNTDFSKYMLLNMCKTAIGQANINAQEMQNIGIYIPPIELQQKFVDIKTKVEQQKVNIQKSLDKLETLKKALMQKYFG